MAKRPPPKNMEAYLDYQKKRNVGLGMLGDNEEGLLRALSYVKGD